MTKEGYPVRYDDPIRASVLTETLTRPPDVPWLLREPNLMAARLPLRSRSHSPRLMALQPQDGLARALGVGDRR